MIYSVKGELIVKNTDAAVISCGGVGFKCMITLATYGDLPAVGNECMLYTYLNVKEDALDLYGFSTTEELECFKLLTSVSGVGPKFGLAMLSTLSPKQTVMCIATGDAKSLTAAPGIGPKLANRIVLELKDKVGGIDFGGGEEITAAASVSVGAASNVAEAINAMVALGYTQAEATAAVSKLDSSLSVEDLIKGALKAAMSGR